MKYVFDSNIKVFNNQGKFLTSFPNNSPKPDFSYMRSGEGTRSLVLTRRESSPSVKTSCEIMEKGCITKNFVMEIQSQLYYCCALVYYIPHKIKDADDSTGETLLKSIFNPTNLVSFPDPSLGKKA